jgi:hypothetical protein
MADSLFRRGASRHSLQRIDDARMLSYVAPLMLPCTWRWYAAAPLRLV